MKPPSIFAQIFALAFALLLITFAAVAAVLLLIPPPERARMSVDEMSWALDGQPSSVIDRLRSAEPPKGIRSRLVEEAIARQLRRPAVEFRAVWLKSPDGRVGDGQSLVLIDGRETIIDSGEGGFTLRYGPNARLATSTLLPLITAARRNLDGSWTWAIPRDPELTTWRLRWIAGLAAGTVLLILSAWLVAKRISRPIEKLGRDANRADLRTSLAMAESGPREVREASAALVWMHRRMADAAEAQVRLLAAVAHDLRTPLTAIRLRVEPLSGERRRRIVDDLDRMTTMIDETLGYAEATSIEPKLENVALDRILRQRVEAANELGGAVTLVRADPVVLLSDRMMLQRMIDNLVENGLRFASKVELGIEQRDCSVVITVADDGPGIPADRIAQIASPFTRLEESRNRAHGGVGLGLSIIDTFATALGATFTLENTSTGLRASLQFPIAPLTGRAPRPSKAVNSIRFSD